MFFTVKKVQRNEITGIYLVCFLLYIKLHVTSSQPTIFEKFWIKKLSMFSKAELSALTVYQMADSPDCVSNPPPVPTRAFLYGSEH